MTRDPVTRFHLWRVAVTVCEEKLTEMALMSAALR